MVTRNRKDQALRAKPTELEQLRHEILQILGMDPAHEGEIDIEKLGIHEVHKDALYRFITRAVLRKINLNNL